MYYIVDNQKDKWIVLVHCVCGNSNIFLRQMDLLSAKYNIIFLKLAGHSRDTFGEKFSIQSTILEIEKIRLQMRIEKWDMLGISLGAMVISKYANSYPERIGKLFLVGAIYRFYFPLFNEMYSILNKVKRLLPRCIYMFLITYIILPSKNERNQRGLLYRSSLRMSLISLYTCMEEMGNFIKNGKRELRDLTNKDFNYFFIFGEKDKLFLNYVKKFCKKEKLAGKLRIVKNAGHLCNINSYQEFNKILEREIM